MAGVERNRGKIVDFGLPQIPVVGELVLRNNDEILTLNQAREEYLNNPTPESVDQVNRAFWVEACRVEGKGRKIIVPDLPKTVEVGKDVIAPFDPLEISLVDLGNMFPEMECWVTKTGLKIVDNNDNSGHFLAKMTVDAPYRNTTEGELCQQLKEVGEQQMSLKHYIIFGLMMYELTGRYPDQNATYSRLASGYWGSTLSAGFVSSRGALNVRSDMGPQSRHRFLGGRGEKRIEAA